MVATFGIAKLVNLPDGLDVAGVFFNTTALVSIIGTSMAFGTQVGLVYFMPRVLTDDRPDPRALLRVALGPVALASFLAALAVFAFSGPLGQLFGGALPDETTAVLKLLAPTIPAWSLTAGFLGATRGLGTVTPTTVIQQVGRPALQIAGLVILAITDSLTPQNIAIAWGIPVVLAAFAAAGAVAYLGGMQTTGAGAVESKEYWSFVRPNAVSNSLQIALERGDQLVIGAVLGTAAAGVYGSLSRFATAGNFIGYAISQAVSPNIRKAVNAGKEEQVLKLFHKAAGWMILATLPYLLIVGIKTVPLAGLLNSELIPDSRLLSFLVIGMVVNVLTGPVELHLLMRGHSKTTMKVTAGSLITDVVLILVLGSWLGLTGAAIAWAISLGGKNLVNTYFSNDWYGVTSFARPAVTAAVIAVLAIVPIGLATPNNNVGLIITLAVGAVIGLGGVVLKRNDLGLSDFAT